MHQVRLSKAKCATKNFKIVCTQLCCLAQESEVSYHLNLSLCVLELGAWPINIICKFRICWLEAKHINEFYRLNLSHNLMRNQWKLNEKTMP